MEQNVIKKSRNSYNGWEMHFDSIKLYMIDNIDNFNNLQCQCLTQGGLTENAQNLATAYFNEEHNIYSIQVLWRQKSLRFQI